MGVTGHEHILVLLTEVQKTLKQRVNILGKSTEFLAVEEFEVDKHLVVARTSRVNLLAHVAQSLGEHLLHLRVNVLNAVLDDKLTCLDFGSDVVQLGIKSLVVFTGEQTDALEHGDVSD